MTLDSLKNSSHESTKRMIDRVEGRAATGAASSREVQRTFGIVEGAMEDAKELIDDKGSILVGGEPFYSTAEGRAWIKTLSNPWTAWGANGTFKGGENAQKRSDLQSILREIPADNTPVNRARRYARQAWRTEMTEYILEAFDSSSITSEIMLEVLSAQKVPGKEDTPEQALTTAIALDTQLNPKTDRSRIAAGMKNSGVEGSIEDVGRELDLTVEEGGYVKVIVGGEFIDFPEDAALGFQLKNVFYDSDQDRVYAQMKNGCEGNLVVIEISDTGGGRDPGSAPSPEPSQSSSSSPNPAPAEKDSSSPEASEKAERKKLKQIVTELTRGLDHTEGQDISFDSSDGSARKRFHHHLSIKSAHFSIAVSVEKGTVVADPEGKKCTIKGLLPSPTLLTLKDALATALYITAVEEKMDGKMAEMGRYFDPYDADRGKIDFQEALSPFDPDLAPGKNATEAVSLEQIRDLLNTRHEERWWDRQPASSPAPPPSP
jgi:hypothetical protein